MYITCQGTEYIIKHLLPSYSKTTLADCIVVVQYFDSCKLQCLLYTYIDECRFFVRQASLSLWPASVCVWPVWDICLRQGSQGDWGAGYRPVLREQRPPYTGSSPSVRSHTAGNKILSRHESALRVREEQSLFRLLSEGPQAGIGFRRRGVIGTLGCTGSSTAGMLQPWCLWGHPNTNTLK